MDAVNTSIKGDLKNDLTSNTQLSTLTQSQRQAYYPVMKDTDAIYATVSGLSNESTNRINGDVNL